MLDLIDVELGKSSPMITEHYESKTVQQVANTVGMAGWDGWLGPRNLAGQRRGPVLAKTPIRL